MTKQQSNGNILKKEAFKERAQEMPTVDVYIAYIDGTIRLRAMTCGERDKFLRRCLDGEIPASEERPFLLQLCIIKENGEPMFSVDEIDEIAAMSHQVLDPLTEAAQRINWMHADSGDDAAKNSKTDRD